MLLPRLYEVGWPLSHLTKAQEAGVQRRHQWQSCRANLHELQILFLSHHQGCLWGQGGAMVLAAQKSFLACQATGEWQSVLWHHARDTGILVPESTQRDLTGLMQKAFRSAWPAWDPRGVMDSQAGQLPLCLQVFRSSFQNHMHPLGTVWWLPPSSKQDLTPVLVGTACS